MSAPADTCTIPALPVARSSTSLRCDSPEALAELVEMLRAELPAGWTLVEVES